MSAANFKIKIKKPQEQKEMARKRLTTMRGGDGSNGLAAKLLRSSGSKREGGGRSVRGSGMPAIAPLHNCTIKQQTDSPRNPTSRQEENKKRKRTSVVNHFKITNWQPKPRNKHMTTIDLQIYFIPKFTKSTKHGQSRIKILSEALSQEKMLPIAFPTWSY